MPLPEYNETLRPDFAVRDPDPEEKDSPWQLLVKVLEPNEDMDKAGRVGEGLDASPHSRMERLLRKTGVLAGLLVNGRYLRLISAPRGESSGWIDFRVKDMVQVAGRPICSALRLLLGESRLLTLPRAKRLAALLKESREYQNEVSERLAEQVLHALYELLRGFQTAHEQSGGRLLQDPLSRDPDEVYRGLLTVLLRMVFLFYAEEKEMLPRNETWQRYYSLGGLYQRLREDAALYPDTMDHRFGAWPQLLVLFRLIHEGAELGAERLPARHGTLFDPDRFPFLEGRRAGQNGPIAPPRVPDGTVYRTLEKLLVLDGERISYRALDVEQIGSVYQAMMGFRLEKAAGVSVAIRAPKKWGAPTTVDLEALLAVNPAKRVEWLQERADRRISERMKKGISEAKTLEDLHAALEPLIDKAATPDRVSKGAMVLQPSEERRRSGSHYTPRKLTEPIVRTTLEPILERLRGPDGRPPRPEQILDLKVCDPAMGSGAFLVEACRFLADALVESWHAHNQVPPIPPDEDEVIHARRLVAQNCLYGVDRNPVAVDLAKMSLWLATLAKDHAFTFLDHALRHGDSLVGLGLDQISVFHWKAGGEVQKRLISPLIEERIGECRHLRDEIRRSSEADEVELSAKLRDADEALSELKLIGDLVVSGFFSSPKPKERNTSRQRLADALEKALEEDDKECLLKLEEHRNPALVPFHWQLEFPEVFERENPGFDAILGNPPFGGKNTIIAGNPDYYLDWLQEIHPDCHGNADLVAHFFRRAFNLLRQGGAFGLIATKTIGQGDTRSSGLRWICRNGGEIFCARRRLKWPGLAAVVVSVVHVMKGEFRGPRRLDGREVEKITAYLFHRGGHDDPVRLTANAGKSFVGSYVLGMGFTFDDSDRDGIATPIAEMRRLIEKDPANKEVIFPYIGGEEVNTHPAHEHHRYVINFGERSEEECRRRWPDLMAMIEKKVRPERAKLTKNEIGRKRARMWWQYGSLAKELYAAIAGLERVLAVNCGAAPHMAFALLSANAVFAHTLCVFPFDSYGPFAVLQSRVHETWVRFFASSLEDRLRYTPSDCFETFPFPERWDTRPALEAAGKVCYEFRAALMIRNNEGLTKTYNRFHDPNERQADILRLRELHAAMDRAVLDAYGWTDIPTRYEFLLDYEIDEEEWGDKKKPYRYRWPDDIRDEVLARLLELNARRAREEALSGAARRERPGRNRRKRNADQEVMGADLL
ncbi:MAG TPA: DNA methyltransferase [Planctomycetota bacterium]|nr:DNA methyltransferase [Planctomycetota bacterium]